MFNRHESEEKELEAIQLIDQAEDLADEGNGDEAIQYYEKAAQIYLDLGSYIKLDELYTRIAKMISRFKNHIQAVHRLRNILRKTEELKLDDISAKLYLQLGNISYKMMDWETAADSWQKASNCFYNMDPEENYQLSSILLMRAGQAFEKTAQKDEGKRLILKAIMKVHKFDELYQTEEKRALHFLESEKFRAAANKFIDIAGYFKTALEGLDELLDEDVAEETKLNAQARFLHFVAEYQVFAVLSLEASKKSEFKDEIKNIGLDSIDLFKKTISLLKEYLIAQKTEFDPEVIMRITFDTMLLSIIQEFIDVQLLDPMDYLLENTEENKRLVKAIRKTPYFGICERIKKVGIVDSLDKLAKTNLGHFEKIKNILISYFT
jgi:tetratricopeptide (TPR) repeat protein